MTKPTIRKIYWSLLGIMLATTLFFSAGFKVPVLDEKANTYFTESISKAGLAYATCRIINGSISILQNSDLNLEPAGIGVTIALGQILDPIDDMTERLSDVLVTAIVSLGIQKLAYEISLSFVPPILSILLFILSLLIWFENKKIKTFQKTIIKITFVVMIIRFCLPISSIANNFLHENFFKVQISETKDKLSLLTTEFDGLEAISLPETSGFFGTITNNASLLLNQSTKLTNAIRHMKNNMGNIIANLVKLTTLYVGVFLIQVIILPIAVFWLLIKMTNSLFQKNLPVIIKHPRSAKDKKTITINSEEVA
ncbi:MAG: hypothetical protein KAJ62_14695 [Desulfobacteraceae bacterium]|nr:hypothetical protein [Desulfobacteraceae bacterium]